MIFNWMARDSYVWEYIITLQYYLCIRCNYETHCSILIRDPIIAPASTNTRVATFIYGRMQIN